ESRPSSMTILPYTTLFRSKPDEGGVHSARNRVYIGPDLPALIALRSNDQRDHSVPQSCGTCGFAAKPAGAYGRAGGLFRKPLCPSRRGIESGVCAATGARKLS